MRKDKRDCKNPIIVNNMAFPCCKCGICKENMYTLRKGLKKKTIKSMEVHYEYIF